MRAVIAKSFARIHRRNLALNGIAPLRFASEDDYNELAEGDELRVEGVREALESGTVELVARVGDRELRLTFELLPGEPEVLLAGGLLALIRQGGR